MSFIQREQVTVTTIADGSAEAFLALPNGKLSQIRYVKDGSNGYSNGVVVNITLEATGETLWSETGVNASTQRAPRQAAHTTLGAAAGAGVLELIAISGDRAKINLTSGGDTKSGVFHFLIE